MHLKCVNLQLAMMTAVITSHMSRAVPVLGGRHPVHLVGSYHVSSSIVPIDNHFNTILLQWDDCIRQHVGVCMGTTCIVRVLFRTRPCWLSVTHLRANGAQTGKHILLMCENFVRQIGLLIRRKAQPPRFFSWKCECGYSCPAKYCCMLGFR